jgi:hypothetical protein
MEFEVRIPSLTVSGQVHYFFSCECGRVTSQARSEPMQNENLKAHNEIQKIDDAKFRSWATRSYRPPEWSQKVKVEAGAAP